jgi:hypothetical protein
MHFTVSPTHAPSTVLHPPEFPWSNHLPRPTFIHHDFVGGNNPCITFLLFGKQNQTSQRYYPWLV